jgi:hypothetical protein
MPSKLQEKPLLMRGEHPFKTFFRFFPFLQFILGFRDPITESGSPDFNMSGSNMD